MADNRDGGFSYGSSLIVFLLGAAVGATVAILYAPMSGEDTRAQLADKAGQLKDKAVDLKEQAVEKAGQLKEKAVSRFQGAADDTAAKLNATADSATRVADTVKTEAGHVGDTAP